MTPWWPMIKQIKGKKWFLFKKGPLLPAYIVEKKTISGPLIIISNFICKFVSSLVQFLSKIFWKGYTDHHSQPFCMKYPNANWRFNSSSRGGGLLFCNQLTFLKLRCWEQRSATPKRRLWNSTLEVSWVWHFQVNGQVFWNCNLNKSVIIVDLLWYSMELQ